MIENTAPAEASYADLVRQLRQERDAGRRVDLQRRAAEAAEQAAVAAVLRREHPRVIAGWRGLAQRHRRQDEPPAEPRRDETPEPPAPQGPSPMPTAHA